MDIHTEQTYLARLPEPLFCQSPDQQLHFASFASKVKNEDFWSKYAAEKHQGETLPENDILHDDSEASPTDITPQHLSEWPSSLASGLDEVLQSHLLSSPQHSSQSSSDDESASLVARKYSQAQELARRAQLDGIVFSLSGVLGCLDGLEETSHLNNSRRTNIPHIASHTTAFDALLQDAWSIPEDALSLDHPSRFYDVRNFVEKCMLGRWQGRILQPTSTISRSLRSALPQHEDLYKQDLLVRSNIDMQGIDWSNLGTTRAKASMARVCMHPESLTADLSRRSECDDDTIYRFHSSHGRHRARFAHHQLRNVVAATSRSDIFYASGDRVYSASLAFPSKQETVMATKKMEAMYHFGLMPTARDPTATRPFCITCLATSPASSFSEYASSNVLLAGGYNGEYAMLNLNAESTSSATQGIVSHAFDGLITHVSTYNHHRSGSLQAAFCTNDSEVRIMDIETRRFVSDLRYSFVMNASCTSKDGRLRALVGDSCDTLITDVDKGNVQTSLSAHSNYSFACAWSPDNKFMATASQDGTVKLWDARSWQVPLQSLSCLRSCVRWLDFTDDNKLVMAENDDVVSIYDPSADKMQDLTFFGSVAGAALLDGGSEIVVANSDRTVGGLLVYERDSISKQRTEPVYSAEDKAVMDSQQRRRNKWSSALDGVVL